MFAARYFPNSAKASVNMNNKSYLDSTSLKIDQSNQMAKMYNGPEMTGNSSFSISKEKV